MLATFLPLSWIAIIIPLLHSRELLSLEDGISRCPPAFITDAEGRLTNEINPVYEAWIQLNQLVLSWSASTSPTPNVLFVIVNKICAPES